MSEKTEEIREAAHQALLKPNVMARAVEELKGPSRRNRQKAANIMAVAAHMKPEKLEPYIGDLVDALCPGMSCIWSTSSAVWAAHIL